jgi:hypothetical protein
MEWTTRECGNVASVLACNFRPPWYYSPSLLFHKVVAFLKRRNERYVPKKAKVLTKEQVEKFILETPDEK